MKRTKKIWRSMWQRCGGLSGNAKGAKKYQGIITVCDRWRDFNLFIEDMGVAPENYSLDRKENDKGYCKENCRWVTYQEQTRNRGITIKVTYQNKEWFLKDLADHLGIRYDTLWRRIQAGWKEADLGKKPDRGSGSTQRRTRKVSYQGKEYFLKDLSNLLNIEPETLWSRVQRGWKEEEYSKKTLEN